MAVPCVTPSHWRLWQTIRAWWPAVEVLIEHRITNARTEAANTSIKHIKRTGRVYGNPRHHQARILLTSDARQERIIAEAIKQATELRTKRY